MKSGAKTEKDYLTLAAGKFSVGYQNGTIRHVRHGETEIIRNIYTALRDENWRTYEYSIERESIERGDNHFRIDYDCYYESDGARIFEWHVIISGDADGKISYEVKGTALTDILKNRAGICVLHPLKFTAGNECELIHPDGSKSTSRFPNIISADNPFKNLSGFRWACRENWYALQFEGDIFETEDQRNWCDASYKTFCTPLSKPFPVLLKAGEVVHQKVIFQPESTLEDLPGKSTQSVDIVALGKTHPLPRIGIAASSETDSLHADAKIALCDLGFSHYRIEVTPSQPNWKEKFVIDKENSEALQLPLEIALHVLTEQDIRTFCNEPSVHSARILHIILLSAEYFATTQWLSEKAQQITKSFPGVLVGAGTDHNYRELNCNPFDASPFAFVSYSIDPQEHAVDDLTIIENIEAINDTIVSATAMYGKPVHISSLTLRKRFNPAATVISERVLSNEEKSDPRQSTFFAGAFVIGCVKAIVQAGGRSVTLFQTVGSQGLMSVDGRHYPVYYVLRYILHNTDTQVILTESTRPLEVDAILLAADGTSRLLLANYTSTPIIVTFQNRTFRLSAQEIRMETIV